MNFIKSTFIGLGLFALPFVSNAQLLVPTSDKTAPDSVIRLTAEAQGLEPIESTSLPPFGTFWLVGSNGFAAPYPCLPPDAALVYRMTDGQYLIDGTDGQVSLNRRQTNATVADALAAQAASVVALIAEVQTPKAQRLARTMSLDGGPLPPGAGDGGGEATNTYTFNGVSFDTNQLWLELTNVSSGLGFANLHHATNQVYAIWSTTDLTVPFADWQVLTEVWPTDTNCQPFTVATYGQSDMFLRAQDWTSVFTNGLPAWWTWYNFHTLDLSWTNQDANGNTLWFDYTNHSDPNTIIFTIAKTNTYVNTANLSLPLNVMSGFPGYAAVLINDTNLTDAVWLPFNGSNVVATLGADGVYNVAVGLRGFPTNAMQVWETIPLIKDTIFPRLTITNPASATVAQTLVQFQGFASEPLDTLTYDITNAAGTFTNQQGDLTGVFYDPNLLAYTTNYFQSGNIYLAGGANVITLHGTDWAGNTTNVSFTVNFIPSTNPPILTLFWPEAGAPILGTRVTLKAHVSDTTAAVTATVNGTAEPASVAADGSVWVQNLSLNPGNNAVTLTASTALGGMTATNFSVSVVTNSVGLTVSLDAANLNQGSILVEGTINDLTTNCVYVNGVKAQSWYSYTVDNGVRWGWFAEDVPVNAYGMADVKVDVYQGDPIWVASTSLVYAQPLAVVLKSYSGHQALVPDPQVYPDTATEYDNINWADNNGGSLNDFYWGFLEITAGTNGDSYMDGIGPFTPPWEYASLRTSVPGRLSSFDNHINTRVMIEPGEVQPAGTTNLYLVLASAFEMSDTNASGMDFVELALSSYSGDIGLPPEWLEINGQQLANTGQTNSIMPFGPNGSTVNAFWGATIVSAMAGDTPNVTPVATRVYKNLDYTFDVQAYQLRLKILDASGNDLTLQTNTVIVGQQMNLHAQLALDNGTILTNYPLSNFHWTVQGQTVKRYDQISEDMNSYSIKEDLQSSDLTSNSISYFWINGGTNLEVDCTATVQGKSAISKAYFIVNRPMGFLTTVTTTNVPPVNIVTNTDASIYLQYGTYTTNAGQAGIYISLSVSTPTNGSGSFGYLQMIDQTTRRWKLASDGTPQKNQGTNLIDRFLGVFIWSQKAIDNNATNSGAFTDEPAQGLQGSNFTYNWASANDQFTGYLIYRPSGDTNRTIWVTLSKIDWNWSGAASRNTNGVWSLDSGYPSPSINPTNQDSTELPIWNGTAFSLPTLPDN